MHIIWVKNCSQFQQFLSIKKYYNLSKKILLQIQKYKGTIIEKKCKMDNSVEEWINQDMLKYSEDQMICRSKKKITEAKLLLKQNVIPEVIRS